MSKEENLKDEKKKLRVQLKARLIDRHTQEENKDFEIVLDTNELLISDVDELENLPLKFEIIPKELLKMSHDASKESHHDNQPSRRTHGHVSIDPAIPEYINNDNQSIAASSIFHSNILEDDGFVHLQNQTTPAPSHFYDPNASVNKSRRFVFKIPAIRPGDTNKKVIRTKIIFNLKNLMQHSLSGSDDHRFIYSNESDVEEVKKVPKRISLMTSQELLDYQRSIFGNEDNVEVDQKDDENQARTFTPVYHSPNRRSTDHHSMEFMMNDDGKSKDDLSNEHLIESEMSELSTISSPSVVLKDISFPENKSLENLGESEELKVEMESLKSMEVELVVGSIETTSMEEIKSVKADILSDDVMKNDRKTLTSKEVQSLLDHIKSDKNDNQPTQNTSKGKAKFPHYEPLVERDPNIFPVHSKTHVKYQDSKDSIKRYQFYESREDQTKNVPSSKAKKWSAGTVEVEPSVIDPHISESFETLTDTSRPDLSDPMPYDTIGTAPNFCHPFGTTIGTVQSSLQELSNALENSLKIIAETKFKAVSLESTVPADVSKPEQRKRMSVSFMNVPQSTPISADSNSYHLSNSIGSTDATMVESVFKIAQVWKELKEKIIADRHNTSKSYSDILTENERIVTFAELVKQVIGVPPDMKGPSVMKDSLIEKSSQAFALPIPSTETLNSFNYSPEPPPRSENDTVRSLQRLSKQIEETIIEKEDSRRSSRRRSSNKSTLNLLHPSEDSIAILPSSEVTTSMPPEQKESKDKCKISLSDSQLRILAEMISEKLQSHPSISSSGMSNVTTRSMRMESGIKDLQQEVQDMKEQILSIASASRDSYNQEVIIKHEEIVDDLEAPEQVIVSDIQKANRIMGEFKQNLVYHKKDDKNKEESKNDKK